MNDYIEFDLKIIADELGVHFQSLRRNEYTATCPKCGEAVAQTDRKCPVCKVPVIWVHSGAWRDLYGSATAAKRELSTILPQNPVETTTIEALGLRGFANNAEQQRFQNAASFLSNDRIRGMTEYVCRKHRGRAGLAHLVNWMKKEAKGVKQQKTFVPAEVPLIDQI